MNEPDLSTALSCAGCTSQLTRFQTGLLQETDAEVVAEHIESCPNCRLFADQLDAVAAFVGSDEPADLPDSVSAMLADSDLHDADHDGDGDGDGDVTGLLRSLCRLADSLDPNNAEELVQQTFLAALEADPGVLEFAVLAQNLTDRAVGDPGPTVRSFDDFLPDSANLDIDADSAELLYPNFYEDGPDTGRHVDAPNSWGTTNTLRPDDDLVTTELYGVVDSAIAQLTDPQGQLLQLVDIDGLSVAGAALTLRLDDNEAADALHRARVHLRGIVNEFVTQ